MLESGEISTYKLENKGKLFQKKDKNEEIVRVAEGKLRKVLGEYLND